MSGETIRSVVIKIALEQQPANLVAPKTSDFTSGIATAMAGVASVAKNTANGVEKIVEDVIQKMGTAFTSLPEEQQQAVREKLTQTASVMAEKQAAEAERAYDREAKAAQSAYSRIMAERARNAADAEKQYDKEAAEALAAYSRIMRAREQAAEKEAQLARQADSLRSSILSAYGAGTMGALQLAKGIGFVTAASEKEAEAFARSVAKVQGYFDLMVGGIHVLKSLNDVHRMSIALLTAEAAATATLTASNVALQASQGGAGGKSGAGGSAGSGAGAAVGATVATTAMTYLAGAAKAAGAAVAAAFTAVTVAVGAAAIAIYAVGQAYIYWITTSAREDEKAEALARKRSDRAISRINREAEARRQAINFTGSASNSEDTSAIARQIADLETAKNEFQKAFNEQPMHFNSLTEELDAKKKMLDYRQQELEFLRDQERLESALVTALNNEAAVATKNLQIKIQEEETEKQRYQSTLQRIGAMTNAELARAKRIQGKLDSGGNLTRQEEQFILQNNLRGANQVRERQEKRGAANADLVNGNPLETAQRNRAQAQKDYDTAIGDINAEIKVATAGREKLVEAIQALIKAVQVKQDQIEAIQNSIKDIEKENETRWIKQKV